MADEAEGAADVETIIARARALLGTRFRLHGRDRSGLDCVGLVACACNVACVPSDYDLHSANPAHWMSRMDQVLVRGQGPLRRAAVLLMQAGPAQLHLGLWSGDSLIHAHAGLRRVVETPGQLAWPVIGHWYCKGDRSWRP